MVAHVATIVNNFTAVLHVKLFLEKCNLGVALSALDALSSQRMSKKTTGRTTKARGVSLPQEMDRIAIKKVADLDVTFSKYVQRLIRLDIEKNLLRS